MTLAPLHAFIRARQALADTRHTEDQILRHHHFTNIRREDDRVTRWIASHWRTPHQDDPDLFFAMAVARHINKPPTLQALGYPVPWNPNHFTQTLKTLQQKGPAIFGSAYMIKTGRTPGVSTIDYLSKQVLGPMWTRRHLLRPRPAATLAIQHALLKTCFSIGDFMAQQIVADLMYVPPLRQAEDWFTWCAPGPGSQRGLNLLLNQPLNKQWALKDFQQHISEIQLEVNRWWAKDHDDLLHAQNITNALCEFSKYRLAQLGVRNPKRKYRPLAPLL